MTLQRVDRIEGDAMVLRVLGEDGQFRDRFFVRVPALPAPVWREVCCFHHFKVLVEGLAPAEPMNAE